MMGYQMVREWEGQRGTGGGGGWEERAEKKEEKENTPFEERVQVMVSDLEWFRRIGFTSSKRAESALISVSLRFR